MTKRNALTAVMTFLLLSLIVFLFNGIRNGGNATAVAQIQPPTSQNTASLQRFSLSEMIDRSERIFRGTVVDFESGSVAAGGAELPTVTYHLRVEQNFKGEFPEKDGVKYAEITMLGSLKDAGDKNGLRKLSALPKLPVLTVGSDYLLLMTAKSEIGLSTPVGLGQGAFEIVKQDKQELALNEFKNAGLFNRPVKYSDLADQIRKGGKR